VVNGAEVATPTPTTTNDDNKNGGDDDASNNKPPKLIHGGPGAFLKESTLRNLEALLERDRQFREEQEQALSFLKTIKTPLALAETVDGPTSFPPHDASVDADGFDSSNENSDEPESGEQIRRPTFFGGFRQFPPTLQVGDCLGSSVIFLHCSFELEFPIRMYCAKSQLHYFTHLEVNNPIDLTVPLLPR
jgi:hypothetical protein